MYIQKLSNDGGLTENVGNCVANQTRFPSGISFLKDLFFSQYQLIVGLFNNNTAKNGSRAIPSLKQRICGKSLPQEKLAITKVERLSRQGGRLALPGLELVYVWNGFNIIGRSPRLVEAMLELVNKEKERLKATNGKSLNI